MLELTAIIVNYIAAAVGFSERHYTFQPRVHMDGDNSSANRWYYKFSNPNPVARRLTKILSHTMKHGNAHHDLNGRVGLDVDHLSGTINYFADALSRGDPHITLQTLFKAKCPSNTDALSCLQVPTSTTHWSFRRFQPKPEVLSAIVSALHQRNTPLQLDPNPGNWGHFLPEQTISFDFLQDY